MAEKQMKVVLVSTEMVPFSKVGGLADVIGALPDELEKLGCDLVIFTPLYSEVDRKKFGIKEEKGIEKMRVPVNGTDIEFGLCSTLKPGTQIRVYFIDNEHFYGRKGIYTVPETGEAYKDEDERVIFFNRAVIEAIKILGLKPDIIHCNDFHSGLIPVYLSLEEENNGLFEYTGTVFSVHNLAYQGTFEPDFLEKAGIGKELFQPMSPFEFWGRVNLMKMALLFSGTISTVSKAYADEISEDEEYGYGLEGVLTYRKEDLNGILNGIDPSAWDPETDENLSHHFSVEDLEGKRENRDELLTEFGLPTGDDPVIGIVSRLVDQKGFDILSEAFEDLMKDDLKFVILGTGQKKYHELYTELAAKYPSKLGIKLAFSNRLAHLIEAGSDFFMMPSKYEPCGLNQMYSLRYGTIPIVRATGGLKDTISELSPKGNRGNGFTFEEYTPKALIETVERALKFFSDKAAVTRTRKRIMKEDHSWENSAREYIKMYQKTVGKTGMRLTSG
ncbi:MAG: glycogen synthase [Candidatus Krumholzibacteriota bacterium]|nr:glycogen synthase [Candidatus Krumholzibacteriota bacterium]